MAALALPHLLKQLRNDFTLGQPVMNHGRKPAEASKT